MVYGVHLAKKGTEFTIFDGDSNRHWKNKMIKVPVSRQEGERSCVCVLELRGIDFEEKLASGEFFWPIS